MKTACQSREKDFLSAVTVASRSRTTTALPTIICNTKDTTVILPGLLPLSLIVSSDINVTGTFLGFGNLYSHRINPLMERCMEVGLGDLRGGGHSMILFNTFV